MPIDPLGRRNHGSESGTGIVCASEGDLSSPIRYNSSARTRRPGRSDFSFGSQMMKAHYPGVEYAVQSADEAEWSWDA